MRRSALQREFFMTKVQLDESSLVPPSGLTESLLEAVLASDWLAARDLVDEWLPRLGRKPFLLDVVSPLLRETGEKWRSSEGYSLAQSYVAAKLAEYALGKELEGDDAEAGCEEAPVVVLGNVEDDYHALGRRIVGVFLRAAGWRVVDMGIDVEPRAFMERALAEEATLVGCSAMTFRTAIKVKELRKLVDGEGLARRLKIGVGGAAFRLRPGLAEEVGADGTADTAMEAPGLFRRLLESSSAHGGDGHVG